MITAVLDTNTLASGIILYGVATHPEDDLIVAAAISAHADFLVTGDRKLRELGTSAGVILVSPRVFLGYLDGLEKEGTSGP